MVFGIGMHGEDGNVRSGRELIERVDDVPAETIGQVQIQNHQSWGMELNVGQGIAQGTRLSDSCSGSRKRDQPAQAGADQV